MLNEFRTERQPEYREIGDQFKFPQKTIAQLTQQKYTLALVYVAFAGFSEVKVKSLLVPMRQRISRKKNRVQRA